MSKHISIVLELKKGGLGEGIGKSGDLPVKFMQQQMKTEK
jgi:hypothetical protein